MKNKLLFRGLIIISSVIILSSCDNDKNELKIIRSNTEKIKYVINNEVYPNWTIMPEIKPDRLEVECIKDVNQVAFITDIDSIKFTIKEKDTVKFYILLNNKDSALTEIVGIPKNVNFSDAYIEKFNGKFQVEIPEVHELANILVAISKIGQLDSNMIDMTTPYYKEVMSHFLPYKNHPIIDTINKHITKVFDNESYWYYYTLKMNACGYIFDENHSIVDDGIIHKMGFPHPDDPIKANLNLIQDFSNKSNFRKFYKEYQIYYDTLISVYKRLNPIDKMQKWLENQFPLKYGSYKVTFSPLVHGAHSTQRFKDNDFEQTVMFVCRADYDNKYSRNLNEMHESRVVFTEIDHNFVNPISDKYKNDIDTIFANRSKWIDKVIGTSAYENPYAIFNEYMTWAVFTLYCYDNFPEKDVELFIVKMEKQMENDRGFIKFREFNRELLKLYKNNTGKKVYQLYPEILEWCSNLK